MKMLEWSVREVNISGTHMMHLIFADNFIVIGENVPDVQSSLGKLHETTHSESRYGDEHVKDENHD